MLKQLYEKFKILAYPYQLAKKESIISFFIFWVDFFQSVLKVQILAFIVWVITAKNLQDLYFWVIVFISINIVVYVSIFLWNLYDSKLFYKITYKLQSLYLKKFIELDNNKIESLGTWRANNIIIKWIDSWVDIYINNLIALVLASLTIIYSFWVIIYSVWLKYFVLIFWIFLLMLLIIVYGNNLSLKYRKLRKDAGVEYDRNIIKIIMSKFEVLQNNRFKSEDEKLKKWINQILSHKLKEEFIWSIWQTWVVFINDGIKVMLFLWLWVWVIYSKVELSHFVLIYWIVDIIEHYAWDISRKIKMIWEHIVDVDKLIETFDNITEIPWINNPIPFVYKLWDIKIDNVVYWYMDDVVIFNNFSLNISWWKKTAFVGASWSGKTTLVKLIAGYIHPKSWDIIIDNQDISQINLISYYKNIGYLTQEPSVFDGSIMENLTYALDYIPTQEQLDEVIRNAKCEFILEFEAWFETEIWEKWIKLSGGQKQRLAIAKIMLKNPGIILLDEPTSALDSISEQAITEALHNLFAGKTVIIIAHRLQTVKEADEIIVIKDGQIIERGNHEQLSNLGGEYKTMLDLQTSF